MPDPTADSRRSRSPDPTASSTSTKRPRYSSSLGLTPTPAGSTDSSTSTNAASSPRIARWRPPCPAFSPPVMSAPARPSNSLRRLVKAQPSACNCATTSSSAATDLGEVHQHLAGVLTAKQPPQRLRGGGQTVEHIDLVVDLAAHHPGGELRDRFASARQEVQDDEAFHPTALGDQHRQIPRARRWDGIVVLTNRPAHDHAPVQGEVG